MTVKDENYFNLDTGQLGQKKEKENYPRMSPWSTYLPTLQTRLCQVLGL